MTGPTIESPSARPVMRGPSMRRGYGRAQPAAYRLMQPLPAWIWIVACIGVLLGLLSPYPLLTAACCLAPPVMGGLLLFKGESPILFACCLMNWLQVVTAVFYADVFGATLENVLQFPEVEKATWLSLVGTMVVAVGMRTALDPTSRGNVMAAKMEQNLEKLSIGRLYLVWWGAFIVGSMLETVAWKFGSLRSITTPILSIKWIFFYLFAYRVLARNERMGLLVSAMLVEFLSGFSGYFGSFKEVLMMFLVVVMSLRRGLSLHARGLAIVIVIIGFVASIFWSVVKTDYRDYLKMQWGKTGGDDMVTRLEVMQHLISRVDRNKMDEGFKALVARVSYTGWFGATISHVPAFEPHAGGELWLGAVTHVLMPRIFFPNKKALNDSDRARRFTGLRLSGSEEGTSIGIGYMAESYADFGTYGMFFPIYLLGLLMGRIYQQFCRNSYSTLFGTAIATGILFSMILSFAFSNAKIVGALISLSLAYATLNAIFGAGFTRWLKNG